MKIDEGVLSIAVLTLTAALAILLSVGIPIVLAPEPVKLSDWLGFGGAFVGAAVAFIVARVTVGPALRQVRIMGAQAAMQLLPAVKEELDLIDGDAVFLADLEGFQMKLQQITAKVDFWEEDESKLFDLIESELVSSRGIVKALKSQWPKFADRLELTNSQRAARSTLREFMEQVVADTTHLSLTFRPQDESRQAHIKQNASSINAQAVSGILEIINSLARVLGEHRATIRAERERLIAKGDALRRAASDVA